MSFFKKLFNTASKSKEAEPAERNVRYPIPGETSGSPVSAPSPATGSETFYEVDLGAEDVEEKKLVRRQFPLFRPFGWFKERREEKELAERVLLAKGMVAGIRALHPNRKKKKMMNNNNNNNNNRGYPNHFNWRNPVHQLKRKHKDDDYTKNTR